MWPRDHPRIRGEHPVLVPSSTQRVGSSPHTRGAPTFSAILSPPLGIIPAYAGSTHGGALRRPRAADHPRIRGEHVQMNRAIADGSGSSPHTRGARPGRCHRRCRLRIIPAYAGSTDVSGASSIAEWDHPRIRGEHQAALGGDRGGVGSSPHTRGARPHVRGPRAPGRIIPAYAGSTPARPGPASAGPDHPRIRGEHSRAVRSCALGAGSSPHTRGAQAAREACPFGEGIIPAYAGSTPIGRRYAAASADHPRIRGEHSPAHRRRRRPAGSSPHTRGALHRGLLLGQGARIIPAYAGSTPSGIRGKCR